MITAPVNKIIPYSVVDGPGSRAAVFFQSCNIHCAYCHNPETQNLCCGCGKCVARCPAQALTMKGTAVHWKRDACTGCDTCISVCPHHASPKVTEMTPAQVWKTVAQSIPFIRGITVSGGECSLYPEFLTELFRHAKAAGLSCLMDSNGMVDLESYPELMAVCDGVMLDVKSWEEAVYTELTGASNHTVKKNLVYLAERKLLEELRIVSIPQAVDAEAVIAGIARTLRPEQVADLRLKLIRFRPFGVRGELRQAPQTSMEYMQTLESLARSHGFRNIVIV